jgi:2,3,4,5-tetrahydropyridine-2-carboxylate N-succinyltransferase
MDPLIEARATLISTAYATVMAGNRQPLQDPKLQTAVQATLQDLDQGRLRVANPPEQRGEPWVTHGWLQEAILLYFQIMPMAKMEIGPFVYHDKIPLKTQLDAIRVVPPATIRFGAYVEPGAILMPSYVNIGARVGARTLIDTWATVGSCAQIGSDVHLSGGVGIGGVLEPPSQTPVIVEDGAFIGSRCILVEGVRVGVEAVLAAGITLTASTPILDVRGTETKILYGVVPPRAVLIPGTREKKTPHGITIHTACVYWIGERSASTDRKTSLNQALRTYVDR